MIKRFCFLGRTTEIRASRCIYFNSVHIVQDLLGLKKAILPGQRRPERKECVSVVDPEPLTGSGITVWFRIRIRVRDGLMPKLFFE